MSKIIITDSTQFEDVIRVFEQSLPKIKDIFSNQRTNAEQINATSTWTSETQKVMYEKYKLLENNFEPIEESIQLYINFMRKTLEDYKAVEEHINRMAENNSNELNVNS